MYKERILIIDYHTEHLLRMHEYIFGDFFEWAGVPRTISIYKEEDVLGGQSVEYSDPLKGISSKNSVRCTWMKG